MSRDYDPLNGYFANVEIVGEIPEQYRHSDSYAHGKEVKRMGWKPTLGQAVYLDTGDLLFWGILDGIPPESHDVFPDIYAPQTERWMLHELNGFDLAYRFEHVIDKTIVYRDGLKTTTKAAVRDFYRMMINGHFYVFLGNLTWHK
jgi:hypothetical protein